MPEGNILHTDTVTGNLGFPAASTGGRNDILHTAQGVVRFAGSRVWFQAVYQSRAVKPWHRYESLRARPDALAGRNYDRYCRPAATAWPRPRP